MLHARAGADTHTPSRSRGAAAARDKGRRGVRGVSAAGAGASVGGFRLNCPPPPPPPPSLSQFPLVSVSSLLLLSVSSSVQAWERLFTVSSLSLHCPGLGASLHCLFTVSSLSRPGSVSSLSLHCLFTVSSPVQAWERLGGAYHDVYDWRRALEVPPPPGPATPPRVSLGRVTARPWGAAWRLGRAGGSAPDVRRAAVAPSRPRSVSHPAPRALA